MTSTVAANTSEPAPDSDLDALREKYRHERDRRLRSDGEAQYIELSGRFAHFAEDDPFADPEYTREPIHEDVEVVVIGGGWSGLISAARLREAGLSDLRVIEAGADFGGTWYWNRYPGAQCDIDSYCYLPLLEETGYIPKEKYSYAPEIFEHAQRIGKTFGLYDVTHFQTRVRELRWDEDLKRWRIQTNRNDDIKARFVVMAVGGVRAKLPGIPGIETFRGRCFHTSRWDYDYTGGDGGGNLWKLADKKVAIIGTGATAIQCVPYLGQYAQHLYVCQRTPSSVDLRGNKPTDPEWAKTLKPGWQHERMANFNDICSGEPFEVDLVDDAWTGFHRSLRGLRTAGPSEGSAAEALRLMELGDALKMNELRARVDQEVADPRVAELLKPWYPRFCKRPTFNDDYLPTFNRPNVTLVDTSDSKGVERITETGFVANGVEREVDCIIFATGFEMSSAWRRRFDLQIYGREGKSLFDYWSNGMRTFHGHSSHGFPNWFYIGLGQNGLSVNHSSMVEGQARHVAYIITQVKARGAASVQPTPEAEAEWRATIVQAAKEQSFDSFIESCTPGYYNNEGKYRETSAHFAGDGYSPGVNAFNAVLAEWRADGRLRGLELDGEAS